MAALQNIYSDVKASCSDAKRIGSNPSSADTIVVLDVTFQALKGELCFSQETDTKRPFPPQSAAQAAPGGLEAAFTPPESLRLQCAPRALRQIQDGSGDPVRVRLPGAWCAWDTWTEPRAGTCTLVQTHCLKCFAVVRYSPCTEPVPGGFD